MEYKRLIVRSIVLNCADVHYVASLLPLNICFKPNEDNKGPGSEPEPRYMQGPMKNLVIYMTFTLYSNRLL